MNDSSIPSSDDLLMDVRVRPLQTRDLAAARKLVLDGLEERWGWLDETANPDLDDIAGHFAEGAFLVALLGDRLIGTGALLPEPDDPGAQRIVRMSVLPEMRRRGIGGLILEALLDEARARACGRVVLETTATWESAVRFYEGHGFTRCGEWDGDAHFERVLDQDPD